MKPDSDEPDPPTFPLFPYGPIFVVSEARAVLRAAGLAPAALLPRHLAGDWGDVDANDQQRNDEALLCDARLVSRYVLATGQTVCVVTEADRSSTTVLLRMDN